MTIFGPPLTGYLILATKASARISVDATAARAMADVAVHKYCHVTSMPRDKYCHVTSIAT